MPDTNLANEATGEPFDVSDPSETSEDSHASNPSYHFDILCGLPFLSDCIASRILNVGQNFHRGSTAPIKLIIDVPYGFAFHTLEVLARTILKTLDRYRMP